MALHRTKIYHFGCKNILEKLILIHVLLFQHYEISCPTSKEVLVKCNVTNNIFWPTSFTQQHPTTHKLALFSIMSVHLYFIHIQHSIKCVCMAFVFASLLQGFWILSLPWKCSTSCFRDILSTYCNILHFREHFQETKYVALLPFTIYIKKERPTTTPHNCFHI